MNKEQVYDTQLMPLIDRIIAICKEHGIAMIADFALPTTEKPHLCCTSATLDENRRRPEHHIRALRAAHQGLEAAHAVLGAAAEKPR